MNKIWQFFSFTKNETKILLFIVSVLIAGFGIKYYKQVFSKDHGAFNYSASDSVFNSLSEKIYANEKKNGKDPGKKESGAIININTATKNELIGLPGVGDATAEKIINYREQKKGFKKIEDMMNVSGIGKKKFEKMKPFIKTD